MDKGLRLSGAQFDGLLRLYIIYNRFMNFKLKRFFFTLTNQALRAVAG